MTQRRILNGSEPGRPSGGKNAETKTTRGKTALRSDELFAEAGRKILLGHFRNMMKHERAVLSHCGIEDVHRMRVDARRFRSAYAVFRRSCPPGYKKTLRKPMKRTAAALGAVRDMDVLLARLDGYCATVPAATEDLAPVRRRFETERTGAQRRLMRWLNSASYERFCSVARKLLARPLKRKDLPEGSAYRTPASTIPLLVYKRIAAIDDVAHEHERMNAADYHSLRIRCKRLRYIIESFGSLLGPHVQPLVASLKEMQDFLGAMNDAELMSNAVRDVMEQTAEPADAMQRYCDALTEEIRTAREAFPAAYERLLSKRNLRGLARAVGGL